MKTTFLASVVLLSLGQSSFCADADPKTTVVESVRRLAEKPSYRWETKVTSDAPGFFGGGAGTTLGVTEKDSYSLIISPASNSGLQFVTKQGKAAVLLDENWQTIEQAVARSDGGRGGRGGLDANVISDFKMPATEALGYLEQATDFKKSADEVTASLPARVVTELLIPRRFGGRRGAGGRRGPGVVDPQGTVTFWVNDGVLTKFAVSLHGSGEFRGNEIQLDRTITTTISQIGNASVDVPADAREIVDALVAGRTPTVFVPEPGFRKLFNGRDLTGWAGRPGHWTVEDGAIVGRSTPENPARGNNFLIAKDGDKNLIVDDFELRLSYKITPNNDRGFANSGIQYRSVERDNFVAAGYQGDFEAGNQYSGILYDEAGGAGGRGIMAQRGQSVVWTADGKQEVTGQIGDSDKIQAAIKKDDWNEYTVIARGNHLQHFINGVQTIDVFDNDATKRLTSGILALQLHAGPPMTVAFKDIRIKSLSEPANNAVGSVRVADGFKLELLYMVPKESEGSWVASCLDPQGRLVVSDQYGRLYRLALPPVGRSGRVEPEPINLEIGGAHGLLYAFDSLYVMVNEGSLTHGLYRVRDTDGDDQFDRVELLKAIDGSGEHGLHAIVPSPDGKSLYVVCGDQSRVFEMDKSRVPLNWSEDQLLPRMETGFMNGVLAPGGFIARTDPDGKEWELVATGFRNEFDAAFNREGELFTYDADMEWDIGDPWYRPTRVNHVISGAEFGWRNGSGKFPAYYFDSFGSVVDIGPGSPTGISFGYGAKFPAKYQEALFIADWSFGKLYAVHLEPSGASFTGQTEEFVTGQPLPVTDVLVNPADGAMYITVGGRRTQSALYRITYVGSESTAPIPTEVAMRPQLELRRKLESFHGHPDSSAVETVWPHLGSDDRAIRFAARVALEWQPTEVWQDRALAESQPRTAIAALAALIRASARDEFHRSADQVPDPALQGEILAALDAIDWSSLSPGDRVDLIRTYALAFIRLGRPDEATRRRMCDRFEPHFPAPSRELNALLSNMLVYLQAPAAAEKIMAIFQTAPTQEEQIEYAMALRELRTGWTLPLRRAYFTWFVETAPNYRGGNLFAPSLEMIKNGAIATLSDDERAELAPLLAAKPKQKSPQELLAAREFVKEWTVDELVPIVEQGLQGGRDFDRGRQLYGAVACASCHRFNQDGGLAGPELTAVSGRFNVRDLLESMVEPNKVISDQYAAIVIQTKSGRVITGRVGNLSGDSLNVIEDMLSPGNSTSVRRQDILQVEPSRVSLMPAGLLNTLTADEIQDLTAYLLARGDRGHHAFQTSQQ